MPTEELDKNLPEDISEVKKQLDVKYAEREATLAQIVELQSSLQKTDQQVKHLRQQASKILKLSEPMAVPASVPLP